MAKSETAVFAGGCFWCTEALFNSLRGVVSVRPGYTGGMVKNPSYLDVSSGATGHAEAVRIEFDPAVIAYGDLLDVFWNTHNPTTLNRQGNDTGSQYRSAIFYTNDKQKQEALESLKELSSSGVWDDKIVTEIKQLDGFWDAETYHKDYYEKNSTTPYCRIIISPKLAHLRAKYASKLK